jgi:hypothetical protein
MRNDLGANAADSLDGDYRLHRRSTREKRESAPCYTAGEAISGNLLRVEEVPYPSLRKKRTQVKR